MRNIPATNEKGMAANEPHKKYQPFVLETCDSADWEILITESIMETKGIINTAKPSKFSNGESQSPSISAVLMSNAVKNAFSFTKQYKYLEINRLK